METQKQHKPEIIEDSETIDGIASRVLLFNDDWHSFDEVIAQLIKAINCSYEKARALTFEVHVKGKAVVFSGELKECLRVSSILEEIALHTQIVTWCKNYLPTDQIKFNKTFSRVGACPVRYCLELCIYLKKIGMNKSKSLTIV